jgi:hypothetical protein
MKKPNYVVILLLIVVVLTTACLVGEGGSFSLPGGRAEKTKAFEITAARRATKTAVREITSTAEAQLTGTAQSATEIAYAEATASSMAATETAIVEQTQMAINMTETALALQQTLDAADALLSSWSTEFVGDMPEGWTIAREDPSRWDLTLQPGWLHIRGRYIDNDDDTWLSKNIFLHKMDAYDVTVTTRIDSNMYLDGQSAWIGYTPESFRTDGHSIMMGIVMGNNGRYVYMDACWYDECQYTAPDEDSWYNFSATDTLTFPGAVYLKLVRHGNVYTGYFSPDGNAWTYLGELEDFSPAGYFMMGAGGGNQWNEEEFDAFYDFVKFETPKE